MATPTTRGTGRAAQNITTDKTVATPNAQRLGNRKSQSEKLPANPGANIIFSVRQYTRPVLINGAPVDRPMVAFNVTEDYRGWHLSLAQCIAAGYKVPALMHGKTMIVDFYEQGEIMANEQPCIDGGTIVKNFSIEPDLEMLRRIGEKLELETAQSAVSAALAARRPVLQFNKPLVIDENAGEQGSEGGFKPE